MRKQDKIRKYFHQKEKFTLKNKKYLQQVKFLTDFLLWEDLNDRGDITTNLLITKDKKIKAEIIAKENGIIAGLEEIKWLAKSHKLQAISHKNDGQKIKQGDKILTLVGNIKDILKPERIILDILQRMSGIATATYNLIRKTNGRALICPTRKTQWGLLDKKAVTIGGGGTHRLGLYDWILIKDNHLKISNFKSFGKLRTGFQISNFFEIEVKNKSEAIRALKINPGAIMFDNMQPKEIKNTIKILKKYKPNTIVEASGGINEKNIREYAKAGVDVISVGALTHSAKALDMSLKII